MSFKTNNLFFEYAIFTDFSLVLILKTHFTTVDALHRLVPVRLSALFVREAVWVCYL